MATQFCPECHQPIYGTISGVRLSIFKADLVRFIKSHPGQSSKELAGHFYGTVTEKSALAIRSHVYQINDALLDAGVRIRGGPWTGYHFGRSS